MIILFSTLSMMTIMFLFTKHPLSMGVILLMQTITISLITGMMMSKFWYSYILFMVMIGGMLVLFLYMTSVASNMKFKFSWKMSITGIFVISSSMIILMMNDFTMNSLLNKQINIEMTITKFFNFPSSSMMIVLITYLLITLIAVVNITKTNYGPLRQK